MKYKLKSKLFLATIAFGVLNINAWSNALAEDISDKLIIDKVIGGEGYDYLYDGIATSDGESFYDCLAEPPVFRHGEHQYNSLCKILFFEDKVDNVYNYIQSKLSMPTLEINGRLNLYLELDNSIWNAEDEDEDIENRITKEKSNATDLLIDCLEELIENSPDTLKKYGLNQIIPNVHEAKVQEL